ncbi:DUF3159 domain-containing protein [Cellulomonas cellasea]|uniref:DUF3159 domain-containing protein n=1 Tax=Cellulomonas cellasea TaxID=43670 RepID=A0A7W4Y9T0_9CELL|nr:DUF3159 domain-containing protein [Cellulomonas cellasea]MBB2922030.1 hypothetical protein [Cellulomonas cellasea]
MSDSEHARPLTEPAPGDPAVPGDPTGPTGATEPGTADGTAGTPAKPARGVYQLAGEDFSLAEAIGGWRGVIESALPGLVFVVVYVAVRELQPALIASISVAALAVLVRLVQRTPVTQAFSGILGIGIGVLWAWRTGEAQDFFAYGLWVNVAWCAGALLSVLVRWPAVGVIVSFVRGEDMSWRLDTRPAARALRRRYVWATLLWVGVFGARLAVQVPLYLQGEDAVGWLGTAKLVMGVPLFAAGLYVTWLLVRGSGSPREPSRPPLDP